MERDFQLMQWLHVHSYAEAWIGEHHSGGYEIYGRPKLFIATAAERTRYIRLGTGVISLPSCGRPSQNTDIREYGGRVWNRANQ